ncbi:Metalloenzyme, LuxS/M16 peptidase-like protein [Cokeromyces recurvatus]|uniref:Metalloenzyme, LuxS/M16 peptidase-like protein n=1 Tax=Cokeromyces recurvatus TaxID=90255 RepID=UPI00221EAD51|nr:Metalloenzyme, LuxS/M16 peptidase-like protein [Cokeromyces recurvatus]KAI7904653.1 Metalloenzyme, LuxS/M16 peptidase-like protein [Cokeromyces recurvatus]
MSNYKEVCTVPTDFGVTFTKLKSEKTGLTVMLADIEAPLVNGYFTLATESFDDFGCPHTLEHLVFLGSEQYPYKGVLDSLANRAIAQGTNAWTDVDHTCYTITTAGSKGFLNLLPIYVDHILYPTLTDTGYYTEVHHINGEGEDAGVVYSEMQGCQNLGDDRLHLRMKRIIYPETCGYRSETGGLMERLRELSVEKIRNYHQSYYRPDNLCLIITGRVDKDELLKALEPVEESIIKKGSLPKMQRPWISTGDFPNLEKNIEETVLFADEDESMGTVLIAWNGPMCNEFLKQKELEVLNVYLTDSPVSVLQKEFVEIEDALCTDVYFHITDHLKSSLMFTASSVPIEEMEHFPIKFFDTLRRLVDTNDIDMTRMATVIEKERLKLLNSAETDAHDTAALVAITDFLYGSPDGENLKEAVKDQDYLNILSKYTVSDWLNVIKRWYLDAPHVTLYGKPSAEFADQQTEEETNRIEKQRADLGDKRLEELQRELEDAKAKNDVPVPKEILEDFKIPSASTIQFINVITARNNDSTLSNKVQEHINKDDSADVPLFIQFDHIKSHFIKISVHASNSIIPSRLLPYTRLFLKVIFSLPIEKDGKLIDYEEVVKGLGEDTIEYEAALGTSFGFRELAVFTLKAASSKFEKTIQWLQDILWNTQFTVERLKIVAAQILNDIPQAKRDGHDMVNATLRALQVDPKKSMYGARNILFQNAFLQDVVKRLECEPSSVLDDLNEFRSKLCAPENLRIHVTGDILRIENPRTAFKNFAKIEKNYQIAPITLAKEVLKPAGLEPGNHGLLVTLPAIENTFSLHSVKGPSQFDDPDIAPLLVMIELLDTMEGIFWKLIRGQGLAYSCFLNANIESGLISFTIYQSPDAFKAFEQAKNVIEKLTKHEMDIDPASIDGAKSAVIYSLVARENTMDRAALQSFVNQVLKKMPASYNHDMLIAIQNVTINNLQHVLNKYFVNLFKPDTSNVAVISAPTKVTDIQKGFGGLGFELKSITLNDITIDSFY